MIGTRRRDSKSATSNFSGNNKIPKFWKKKIWLEEITLTSHLHPMILGRGI
jgi:hypothetical protein